MLIALILSFLAGVTIVVSRIINSQLGDKIGIFSSTFFNYIVGLSISIVILLFSKEVPFITTHHYASVPFWGYLGGILGVIVVSLCSFTTPRTSIFYFSLFCFVGQLFIGIMIDYLTLRSISFGKIIGGLLVLAGLIYNLMIDKKIACTTFAREHLSNKL